MNRLFLYLFVGAFCDDADLQNLVDAAQTASVRMTGQNRPSDPMPRPTALPDLFGRDQPASDTALEAASVGKTGLLTPMTFGRAGLARMFGAPARGPIGA